MTKQEIETLLNINYPNVGTHPYEFVVYGMDSKPEITEGSSVIDAKEAYHYTRKFIIKATTDFAFSDIKEQSNAFIAYAERDKDDVIRVKNYIKVEYDTV